MAALRDWLTDPSVLRGLALLVVTVDLLALVAIAASRAHAARVKLIWAAIVILLPVAGALAWLALGRERRRHRA